MGSRIEIQVGTTFGRLTTTGASLSTAGGVKWECICACGNTSLVYGHCLRRGARPSGTQSCGCLHSEVASAKHRGKIEGLRFGRLLVLEFAGEVGNKNSSWKCRCDCGKELIILAAALASQRSCGCLKAEIKLPAGIAARNVVLARYKKMARVRGLEFQLADEAAIALFSKDCHYCGSGPTSKQGNGSFGRFNGECVYNGIDRMENSIGYLDSNVVPCCASCNRAKNAMPYLDFLAWIRRLAQFVNRGGLDSASATENVA